MQVTQPWRRAASLASAFLFLTASLVACRDTMTTGDARNVSRITPVASLSQRDAETLARVHKRNPQDWSGAAHNKILDDWRHAMRQPGILTQNLCGYVVDFVARDDRLPLTKQPSLSVRRAAINAAAESSSLCRSRVRGDARFVAGGVGPNPPQESDAMAALQIQIENAITASESSADLAGRLNNILDAAATLNETERTVVATTVSIAQSSFEYWETQYEVLVNEIGAEYGQCGLDRMAAGYSEDAVRDSCMSGTYYEVWFPGSANVLPGRFLSRAKAARCGPSLREGFKKVAKGDAKGAFAGAWAGAFGAAAGIVGGAILGAASGSIWEAGENAWSTYWCIMSK